MLLTAVISLLHYVTIVILGNRIFEYTINKIALIVSNAFLVIGAMLSTHFDKSKDSMLVVYILFFIVQLLFLYWVLNRSKIKTIFLISTTIYLCESIVLYFLKSFFDIFEKTEGIVKLVINSFILVICVVCCYTNFANRIKYIINSTSRTIKNSAFSLMLLCVVNIALMADLQFFITNERLLFVIQVISLSSLLVICIAFPVIVLISTANTHLKNLTKNYEQQIEAQALHYSELSKSNLEIRKFRHDLNNIKIGVAQLIKEGKYQEAVQTL